MPVIFKPEAHAHLDEIFDYIAEAATENGGLRFRQSALVAARPQPDLS
jgi:plasmid stabilization system protein ParE